MEVWKIVMLYLTDWVHVIGVIDGFERTQHMLLTGFQGVRCPLGTRHSNFFALLGCTLFHWEVAFATMMNCMEVWKHRLQENNVMTKSQISPSNRKALMSSESPLPLEANLFKSRSSCRPRDILLISPQYGIHYNSNSPSHSSLTEFP